MWEQKNRRPVLFGTHRGSYDVADREKRGESQSEDTDDDEDTDI